MGSKCKWKLFYQHITHIVWREIFKITLNLHFDWNRIYSVRSRFCQSGHLCAQTSAFVTFPMLMIIMHLYWNISYIKVIFVRMAIFTTLSHFFKYLEEYSGKIKKYRALVFQGKKVKYLCLMMIWHCMWQIQKSCYNRWISSV